MDDGDCLKANQDKSVQRHDEEALKLIKEEEERAKAQSKSGFFSTLWQYIAKALRRRR
jgi:hypothetical protein